MIHNDVIVSQQKRGCTDFEVGRGLLERNLILFVAVGEELREAPPALGLGEEERDIWKERK